MKTVKKGAGRVVECLVDDCDRPASTRGWCATHYGRWRITGTTDLALRPRQNPPCTYADCTKHSDTRGWCTYHYQRWRTTGAPDPPKKSSSPLSRQRQHQIRHPEKHRARRQAYEAKKIGALTPSTLCMMCENIGAKLEAHHVNYDYPLAVIWVCVKCHHKAHPRAPRGPRS